MPEKRSPKMVNKRTVLFNKLSKKISNATGTPFAFMLAIGLIGSWFFTGFYYKWSEGHSLFINTVTTICTFLMTFLIQSSQNRDSSAVQIKLNELIRANKNARNKIIALELTDDKDDKNLRDEFIHLREEKED